MCIRDSDLLVDSFGVKVFFSVLGGLIILNSYLTTLVERKKQIATLSAIGGNPRNIAGIYLSEGVVLGVIGGGIGFVTSIIVGGYLRLIRITAFNIICVFVKSIIFGLIVTLIAMVYPVKKASTLVTPSLLRRWKLSGYVRGKKEITHVLPFKIRFDEMESLAKFLEKKYENSIFCRKFRYSIREDIGEITFERDCIDYTTGFEASCLVRITARKDGDKWEVYVKIITETAAKEKNVLYDVIDLIRSDILSWICLRKEGGGK